MSATPPMTDQERLDRLRLARSEHIGPVTFLELLDHFSSGGDAIKALPELAKRGGRRSRIKICSARDAEAELRALEAIGGQLVAWGEAAYPTPLAALADPPPVLAVRGDIAFLQRTCVAVVGARNASANGRRFAGQLGRELGEASLTVVSGMARGIDTAAHAGSLSTGTVAVLGGGVDVVYPRENAALYEKICAEGAVVSEVSLGTRPQARHFPRRNRIIAGLSLGVVVVEASPKSGSLITARYALDQGRDIFAVPGSPLDPRARGTNSLIRDGATLVQQASDVIGAIEPAREFQVTRRHDRATFSALNEIEGDASPDDFARTRLRELLGPQAVAIDDLIRESQLTPGSVATILLELELAGSLERLPGNQVSLISSTT